MPLKISVKDRKEWKDLLGRLTNQRRRCYNRIYGALRYVTSRCTPLRTTHSGNKPESKLRVIELLENGNQCIRWVSAVRILLFALKKPLYLYQMGKTGTLQVKISPLNLGKLAIMIMVCIIEVANDNDDDTGMERENKQRRKMIYQKRHHDVDNITIRLFIFWIRTIVQYRLAVNKWGLLDSSFSNLQFKWRIDDTVWEKLFSYVNLSMVTKRWTTVVFIIPGFRYLYVAPLKLIFIVIVFSPFFMTRISLRFVLH